MKKLFTLFMATVVAMSMMALPQNVKLAGKKAKPASKEQFEAKNPAQAKVLEMAKDAKVLRDFKRVEKEVKKVPAKSPLKAAAAQTANTIKLHFNGFYTVPEWNEESSDWYMACSNGEGWIVKFDILAESYVGTFTESDLDLYYSYILTDMGENVEYEKVVLTISETVKSQYCKVLNLHAVIDGSDGNVYEVTCEHSFLSPKAEVSHTITGATMSYDDMKELATLAGKNADLDMTLAYVTTWPTGTYKQRDFDMDATKVTYKGIEQQLLDVDMLVKSDMVDGTLSYVADVNYYDQDTVLNKVSVTAPMAPATDTVNIEILNLQVDESWAAYFDWVYLTGANNEWDIYVCIAAMQAEEGEWAGEEEVMLYVTDKVTGESTEAIYATVKMVKDDEKGWLVSLEGYCKDGRYYVVDMKFEIPEPTIFKTITFENSCAATFYPDLGNDLLLENSNDSIAVGIDIQNVPMGGTFTYDDMDANYSYLLDGEEEVMIGAVEGKVYQVGDTTRMDVVIKGLNAVQYTIELWYAVPTPKETVKMTIDAAFDNQLEDGGYYTLSGVDPVTGLLVAMSPITEEVAGTFVNDGLFGKFGDGQYDFDAEYTYIAQPAGVDEWGDPKYDVYSVEKGTMTVTMDAEDNIVATVSVICSNAVQYEITMTSKFDKPHLQYDAEYGVEKNYTAADVVEAEYLADYDVVYWQVEAADGSDICALYFFVDETDADIVVPAGVYPIDYSGDYGSVVASTGYDPHYGVSPSVYAKYDGEYLSIPLWFMVGGTVTVEKIEGKMQMTIDAVNSYDQPIHIKYQGANNVPTALEHIQSPISNCQKLIKDGQLIIIRDGKTYNAQGAVIL